MPFKRAIKGVEDGTYDAVAGVARGVRSTLIYPQETLGEFRTAFFTQTSSDWQWTHKAEDLTQIRLGIITGYEFANDGGIMDYIKANQNNASRIQTLGGSDALDKNIRKLLAGRIDALLDDELVVKFTAKKLGVLDKLRPAGYLKTDPPEYISIGFGVRNPRSKSLASAFDKGVKKLRESGEYDEILARYGLN